MKPGENRVDGARLQVCAAADLKTPDRTGLHRSEQSLQNEDGRLGQTYVLDLRLTHRKLSAFDTDLFGVRHRRPKSPPTAPALGTRGLLTLFATFLLRSVSEDPLVRRSFSHGSRQLFHFGYPGGLAIPKNPPPARTGVDPRLHYPGSAPSDGSAMPDGAQCWASPLTPPPTQVRRSRMAGEYLIVRCELADAAAVFDPTKDALANGLSLRLDCPYDVRHSELGAIRGTPRDIRLWVQDFHQHRQSRLTANQAGPHVHQAVPPQLCNLLDQSREPGSLLRCARMDLLQPSQRDREPGVACPSLMRHASQDNVEAKRPVRQAGHAGNSQQFLVHRLIPLLSGNKVHPFMVNSAAPARG